MPRKKRGGTFASKNAILSQRKRYRIRIQNESEAETAQRLKAQRERPRRRIGFESEAETAQRLEAERRLAIEEAETAKRLEAEQERSRQKRRKEIQKYHEAQLEAQRDRDHLALIVEYIQARNIRRAAQTNDPNQPGPSTIRSPRIPIMNNYKKACNALIDIVEHNIEEHDCGPLGEHCNSCGSRNFKVSSVSRKEQFRENLCKSSGTDIQVKPHPIPMMSKRKLPSFPMSVQLSRDWAAPRTVYGQKSLTTKTNLFNNSCKVPNHCSSSVLECPPPQESSQIDIVERYLLPAVNDEFETYIGPPNHLQEQNVNMPTCREIKQEPAFEDSPILTPIPMKSKRKLPSFPTSVQASRDWAAPNTVFVQIALSEKTNLFNNSGKAPNHSSSSVVKCPPPQEEIMSSSEIAITERNSLAAVKHEFETDKVETCIGPPNPLQEENVNMPICREIKQEPVFEDLPILSPSVECFNIVEQMQEDNRYLLPDVVEECYED